MNLAARFRSIEPASAEHVLVEAWTSLAEMLVERSEDA
jgi:hypothetical protein